MLPKLIIQYGYLAVFIGTFIEGETVLLIGVIAVLQGYLKLPGVIFVSFLGVLGSDQLYYHIGRAKGMSWIEQRPKLKRRSEKAFRWLRKYQTGFILGFRFVYSVRVVTPLIIGISGISAWRYLCYNLISCVLWATGFGIFGYQLMWAAQQAFTQ